MAPKQKITQTCRTQKLLRCLSKLQNPLLFPQDNHSHLGGVSPPSKCLVTPGDIFDYFDNQRDATGI